MKLNTLPLILTVLMLASCKVDFTTNADWKDIPVVYCVLDADDDTSWVRVQRCYLSGEDLFAPASVTDSITYPADDLRVTVLVNHYDGKVDTIGFAPTYIDRAEGPFAWRQQPVYYALTSGRLTKASTYRLEVRRATTGELMASAATLPVIPTSGEQVIRRPYNNDKFIFNSAGNTCLIEWNTLANARVYQPYVTFYYSEGLDTMNVTLECGKVYQTYASAVTMSTNYARSLFLADLKSALSGDPNPKTYVPMVDLYLMACNEDLNAYLSSVEANEGNVLSSQVFSNVEGGLGIFASRSTHIYKHLSSDVSKVPNSGLYWYLSNLGVGINSVSGLE